MPEARVCTIDGCTKPLKALGLCAMHWWRLKKRGSATWDPGSSVDRIVEKIEFTDDCWLWTGRAARQRATGRIEAP